ncbi:MAG: GGDEF domain-containing protein [Pseudomonadota bacterium]
MITMVAIAGSLGITLFISYLAHGRVEPDSVGWMIALIAPAVITPLASYLHVVARVRLEKANAALQRLSETDPLTGTYNRRRFYELASRELDLARRGGYPTSLALMDFDHFKQVNDRYGHAIGDAALVHTLQVIKETVRKTDVLARFGGEEFIVLLPHTSSEGAKLLTERILQAVRSRPLRIEQAELLITLSAGTVTCETSETPLDVMLSQADVLLYEAKDQGRNRFVASQLSCATHLLPLHTNIVEPLPSLCDASH